MRITVITVAFNAVDTIEDTIRSVADQSHPDVEHIVIDGGSTDGTMAIVDRHRSGLARVVSESDSGIYDAMNKGLAMATGDVVGFLNADDLYDGCEVLSTVAATFSDPSVDACYSDLVYVRAVDTTKVVRYWRSSPYRSKLIAESWMPPHPTFFVRRSIYQKYGGFDIRFKIAADAELMTRLLSVHHIRTVYIPRVLVRMRVGGTTNRSLSNILRQNVEILRAMRKHRVSVSWPGFLTRKLLNRGRQFLTKP